MSDRPRSVAVIGGGIAGLAAAYRMATEALKRKLALDVQVLESSGRFGGTIRTSREAGCLMELGPDCFLSSKPEGVALCKELGLERDLIGTNEEHRRSFILRGDALLPVPPGFYLLAPASMVPFLKTPIFSWAGKLRMGLDLLIPRGGGNGDETLASFVRRRLGREALERMAQPMVAGIYSADPEELSLEATFPQFLEMERRDRSIIVGLRRRMKAAKGADSTSGPRYGLFVSLRDGMGSLVDALLERIPKDSLRAGRAAVGMARSGKRWRVELEGRDAIETDAVCLATPARPAARILGAVAPRLAEELDGIPYGSMGTLNLVLRRDRVRHPLDGMGFVVPAVEGRRLSACSFSSTKFAERTPEGRVLLRAFFKEAAGVETAADPGEDIEPIIAELRAILGIQGEPEASLLARYPGSMPQYRVGHLERVARIEEGADALPNFALAGSGYRGVGIPDCVASANRASERILKSLGFG